MSNCDSVGFMIPSKQVYSLAILQLEETKQCQYLDPEHSSVYIVPQEQIILIRGISVPFKYLQQIIELSCIIVNLPMNIAYYYNRRLTLNDIGFDFQQIREVILRSDVVLMMSYLKISLLMIPLDLSSDITYYITRESTLILVLFFFFFYFYFGTFKFYFPSIFLFYTFYYNFDQSHFIINNMIGFRTLLTLSLLILSISSLSIPCQLCHHIVSTVQHSAPEQLTFDVLQKIAVVYCKEKHLQDIAVCTGAIQTMTPFLLDSLWKHYTDPHLICPKIHFCKKQYIIRNLTQEVQNIIKDKPDKQWEQPTKRKSLKILHISDLHPDLFYTPGSQVQCQEPVCCRSNVTKDISLQEAFENMLNGKIEEVKDENVKKPAGYYGSRGDCDLPLQTFNIFLKEISELKLDAIIWTGDNTPHDIWAQTQSYNLNFTILLAEKISQATGAIILPAMGNHESWPVNVYDFQGTREDVLIGGLAQTWRKWLDERAYTMLRTKGYYSMSHDSLNNLKVIGINTQAGNDMNWFLLRDPTDPGEMLVWLQKQLKQSQQNNQFVYIIGHIPPNDNLNDWSMRYNALVDRYAYLIRGQFYGHTHSDHLSFFPKIKQHLQNKNITHDPLSNYYLVAPSITTYSTRIPQYRVMDVDFDTLQVINYHQYRLDVTKYTKKEDNPSFQLLYSFLETYDLEDMTVQGGMTDFRNKLRDDAEIRKLYSHMRSGGLSPGSQGSIICDAMSSPQYGAECRNQNFDKRKKSPFEKYAGPWKDLKHK